MITLRRAYDKVTSEAGPVFLVERLWPRGVKKANLHPDAWLKEVAPSTALRQWFGHDPDKWQEFRRRYFAELDASPAAWEPLLKVARKGRVTLLYSSRDTQHNNAVALKEFLDKPRIARKSA